MGNELLFVNVNFTASPTTPNPTAFPTKSPSTSNPTTFATEASSTDGTSMTPTVDPTDSQSQSTNDSPVSTSLAPTMTPSLSDGESEGAMIPVSTVIIIVLSVCFLCVGALAFALYQHRKSSYRNAVDSISSGDDLEQNQRSVHISSDVPGAAQVVELVGDQDHKGPQPLKMKTETSSIYGGDQKEGGEHGVENETATAGAGNGETVSGDGDDGFTAGAV